MLLVSEKNMPNNGVYVWFIYLVWLHQVKHLIQAEGSADWSPWKSPSSWVAV